MGAFQSLPGRAVMSAWHGRYGNRLEADTTFCRNRLEADTTAIPQPWCLRGAGDRMPRPGTTPARAVDPGPRLGTTPARKGS